MSVTRHRRIVAVLGTAATCVALAGCGGSSSKANPGLNQTLPAGSTVSATPSTSAAATSASTSPTSAAASTSPSSSATSGLVDYAPSPDPADPTAAAVLKAYRAYSDVKVTMYNGAQFSKQLAYVATGKAVEGLTDSISDLRQSGVVFTGRPKSSPSVASMSGDTATVHDCFGGPEWRPVYAVGADKGKNAGEPGTTVTGHPITATLKRFQGVWVVADAVTDPKPC